MSTFSAIILLLAGVFNLYFEWRKRRSCSAPASAVVTEIRRDRSGGENAACVPILRYRVSGRFVEGSVGVVRARRIGEYRIGKTVEIFYNPDKPEDFRIAGKNGVLILSAILTAAGIGGLLLTFLF